MNICKRNSKLYIGLIVVFLMIVQLVDSYCAELYTKMQSFVIDDYIIKGTQLDMNEAVSKLGYMMLPFYIVPALSPLGGIFVDKYGKKRVLLINTLILVMGCLVCGFTSSIIIFLVGNALVTFATSTDIQNIYIVESLPAKRRATTRGIMSGVTAGAAMLIPFFRGIFVDSTYGWKGVYYVAIAFGMVVFAIVLGMRDEGSTKKDELEKKTYGKDDLKDKPVKYYMIILFFIGIATSGITLYNEPMLKNIGYDEGKINQILAIQPVVLLIVNILSGYLADKFHREKIAKYNVIGSIMFLALYVIGTRSFVMPILLGVAWGGMVGCYFSAVNIIFLIVMEKANNNNIGKLSALSAYINGAGNAIGILLCTVLVKNTGMEIVKLITAIPVLVIAMILLGLKEPIISKEN